jgi:hypothetical protein
MYYRILSSPESRIQLRGTAGPMVRRKGKVANLFRFLGMPNPVPASLAAEKIDQGYIGKMRYSRNVRKEGPERDQRFSVRVPLAKGNVKLFRTRTSWTLMQIDDVCDTQTSQIVLSCNPITPN